MGAAAVFLVAFRQVMSKNETDDLAVISIYQHALQLIGRLVNRNGVDLEDELPLIITKRSSC